MRKLTEIVPILVRNRNQLILFNYRLNEFIVLYKQYAQLLCNNQIQNFVR
jgi:hypothetical protein